jgi:hypothetical protein
LRKKYPAASHISIDFGFPSYRVEYIYDAPTNSYLRFQAKKPHMDEGNEKQIAARAIVIQRVKSWSNGDPKLTISIKTIAEGKATIFQAGHVVQGTWKKEALESPTTFFDEQGRKVFLATPTWIEVLPLINTFTFQALDQ